MNLIKQTGPFCLVASAAMILDTTVEELHHEISHDGTEEWWPGHMRGVHIQEIQDCCLRRGKCLYIIEREPMIAPNDAYEPKTYVIHQEDRFWLAIYRHRAILIKDNHAVAWDGIVVHDPRGFTNPYTPIFHEAWILGDLISQK